MTNYWKNVDTILMGRKTYTVSAAQISATEESRKNESRKSEEPAMRTYVFSRTIPSIDQPGVELISTDAAEFVRDLKQRPGKGICLIDREPSVGRRLHPRQRQNIAHLMHELSREVDIQHCLGAGFFF
jgi:hypothetical protein